MNNIFLALSKYPSTIERSPVENQFTEAFAFLMRDDKELLSFILKELLSDKSKLIGKISPADLTIQTQMPYELEEKCIPDITIKSKKDNFVLLIENKIQSDIDEEQLRGYLKVLADEFSKTTDRFVLVITHLGVDGEIIEGIKNKRLVHVYWYELYDLINDYLQYVSGGKNAKDHIAFLLGQFLEYMEVNGLTKTLSLKDFDSFLGEEEENADTRREIAKGKLDELIRDAHKKIPTKPRKKLKQKMGYKSAWGCFGTLSEGEKQIDNAHFSIGLDRKYVFSTPV